MDPSAGHVEASAGHAEAYTGPGMRLARPLKGENARIFWEETAIHLKRGSDCNIPDAFNCFPPGILTPTATVLEGKRLEHASHQQTWP